MAKLVTHNVKVRQKARLAGGFPIDMLRYDRLAPRTETDSSKITITFSFTGKVEIELIRDADRYWEPTRARWESFGWEVVSHTHF